MAKERRTINVSLQSKKYLDPVNKILNEWEEDSLNLSTQICENILLVNQLRTSVTFGNVLAVYELIEKMMKVYHIEDKTQLEKIFSEVITVDNGKLTHLLSQLNNSSKNTEAVRQIVESTPEKEANEPVVQNPTKVTEETTPTAQSEKQENSETVMTPVDDNDFGIPMDFLLNG